MRIAFQRPGQLLGLERPRSTREWFCRRTGLRGSCSPTPVVVSGIENATAISTGSAGSHTCALLSGGQIRCWGNNFFGQLGNQTNSGPDSCLNGNACGLTSVAVTGITDAVAVGLGITHSCAVRATGAVNCWGDNRFGQLGAAGNGLSPVFCHRHHKRCRGERRWLVRPRAFVRRALDRPGVLLGSPISSESSGTARSAAARRRDLVTASPTPARLAPASTIRARCSCPDRSAAGAATTQEHSGTARPRTARHRYQSAGSPTPLRSARPVSTPAQCCHSDRSDAGATTAGESWETAQTPDPTSARAAYRAQPRRSRSAVSQMRRRSAMATSTVVPACRVVRSLAGATTRKGSSGMGRRWETALCL